MYVGRIVVVGRACGRLFAAYRVSSRSFPNRRAEVRGDKVQVSPLDPSDLAKNPYIAYNCIRLGGGAAVVANGSQADTVVEKIDDGMKPLDALALTLLAYGYERDELDTPRLAGAVRGDRGWLGIARKDEIRSKEFPLADGEAWMVATYGRDEFGSVQISGKSAEEIARAVYDLPFERPVCAGAALQREDGGFDLAVYNPPH